MRVLIVLAGLIVVASAIIEEDVAQEEWQTFKLTYGKEYTDEAEELLRKQIFMQEKLKIEKHNQMYEQGLVSFSMGINQFSDLRHEEFARMNGENESSELFYRDVYDEAINFKPRPNIILPKSMDWREHGAVTPVANQGRCGSCWAFSATGALESQHFLKTKKLVSLSKQQLVDCSTANSRCKGGLSIKAFQYVKKNGGIQAESSYQYTADKTGSCKFNKRKVEASVKAFGKIQRYTEKILMEAVVTVGPISISIYSDDSLQKYTKGVYPAPCKNNGPHQYTHAVLVVGYGTENGLDYWLVKNSWSTSWGENGYVKIDRKKNKHCHILRPPVYPIV